MSVIEFLTGVNVRDFVSYCIKAEAVDGVVFVYVNAPFCWNNI